MKLIDSKAELLEQPSGLEGVYKMIEIAGRTCYKSEDKITEDSAKGFVERMVKSGHTAMLEHGTIYLDITDNIVKAQMRYCSNPYSKVYKCTLEDDWEYPHLYVTTNYRVLVENDWLSDLKYICEPTEYHERRYTIRFTTDRGVSHELVRHRVFSFAQESTRYCNYSKDKFDNELTFIIPSWDIIFKPEGYSEDKSVLFLLKHVEEEYKHLINNCGWKPQQARMVLPNCIKTEIVMTGFVSDWKHFFDLRLFGKTGKPHPDMEVLADKARQEFVDAGIWGNEGII